jgi:zinc protease
MNIPHMAAIIATASIASAAPQEVHLPFTQFDLPNGLHVIVNEDNAVPIVAVDVRYHVGSKNEEAGRTGFAHLFEHLMFEGSKNIPQGGFDEIMTGIGAQNNAYTTPDETAYHELIPSNQVETALWLESDRMLQFAVTRHALDTQKDVVKEEKRETDDNRPYGDLEEEMRKLVYPEGCYHWPVIGSMTDIDAATMKDVRRFFETYYVPNNATLSFAGDITAERARILAEKYFGDIPSSTTPITRPAYADPPQTAARTVSLEREVPTPAVYMVFTLPPEGNDDVYAVDLLASILGSGESSRIHHQLVYEQQISSDAGAYVESGELGSLLNVYAIGADVHHDIPQLTAALERELERVRTEGVTARELEKAKNQKESALVYGMMSAAGRAEALSHSWLFHRDPALATSQIEKYRAATIDDVRRVARLYCAPERRNAVNYTVKKGS